ncbi:hypothetical protein N8208_07735 [Planktomarina temperata]|nr:hypothetical protein [Planktomarina temperata]
MHFSDFTYVTRGQLAEELHVTKGTIRQWEDLRGFPKPIPGSRDLEPCAFSREVDG